MSAPLVALRGLTVDFEKDGHLSRAVDGVDLEIAPGEALGIVGESGSGKSVTWLAALGLLPAKACVAGSVRLEKQELIGVSARVLEDVRGKRIAMIFQDPSSCLNPVHRIGWQLVEALRLHRGLHGKAAEAEALRLLDQVGIADARRRLQDYPHLLSGGLNQRVMIAMALAGQPDLLVADEPTTALDATIQAQILALLSSIRRDTGMALVLISHDLGVVAENVDRVAVMYAGRLVEEAPGDDLFGAARHPYTQGLLAALPSLTGPRRRLAAIPGTVPDPWSVPAGCRFAPRCPVAETRCSSAPPPARSVGFRHLATCHRQVAAGYSAWSLPQAAE
ncbi:ABC transporter ATP-binding protein [Reyranella massiliensis]|uniref:ABC transporter ATP-binding protein n=1 Tax=Reyranella massiliensis TaxID=445220 RepID=UPI0002E15996|nr:ABC transporter ATP-binding protein [Reyranella massiliensis]